MSDLSFTLIRGRTAKSKNALHLGFRYSPDGKLRKDGSQSWRCVKKAGSCKGRIWTKGLTLTEKPTIPHDHEADFIDAETKEIYSAAKDLSVTASSSSPSRIMKSVKANATNSALLRLPNSKTFRRALNRNKKVENPTPKAPSTLADLQLDPNKVNSLKGEPMLLHDNEDKERRIVMIGTQKNLDQLWECPSWYIDATFKSSPQLFYQVLSIHGEIPDYEDGNPWTFPCVYICLTHKDEELYDEAFKVLAGLRDFTPDVIMTDFERGLRNSLSSAFPSATIDGCLFHFCQATLKWVRKNGLKKANEEGKRDPVTERYSPSQVRVWVRRLQHLAFLPVDDVASAFTFLCGEIPPELGLDDFLAYFSSTWVQGFAAGRSARFPPKSWNVLDRTSCHLNRTNNYLEAWNKQFAAQVGHAHPTIWNFLAAVYIEQSSTDEKFLFEANGDEPPRRKKRYVTRDRRIEHLVQSYQPDLDKLIPYLDSLRNLMIEN